MPEKDKQRDALQWLRCNPDEKPITAARACNVENYQTLKKAWQRERKKLEALRIPKKLWGQQGKQEKPRWGGQNKILRDDQHAALIQYAVSHAINGGKGATKQMMFNCAMHLRREEKKSPPSWRWFQEWLKGTPELHVIKTKPIASHRVDLHTEQALRRWFEDELLPVIEEHNIQYGWQIHNMDEKGARVCMPAGEQVVVPIGIKEMYTGVPENRISITIVESICADGTAIPPVVIVPGVRIMVSWFHENMTGHEIITVSPTGYTNEGICLLWLDHFIKHNNCGPDKPWRLLLIDGATCHEAPNFILKATMNGICIVKFPSHQTHLLQPCDVGVFREWKHYHQVSVMNAIRSFEAEYNLACFFRDLPKIREKTFTKRTIKHAFRNAGMWPVSFKQIRRKLKEYGKKKRRDTGIDAHLEYGSPSDSSSDEEEPAPTPELLEEEYQLPPLPKEPSSYNECVVRMEALDNKIINALSSSPRKEYTAISKGIKTHLSLGSLHEQDLQNARNAQVEKHKAKLSARMSFQSGGWIKASVALEQKKKKVREAREADLRKAKGQLKKAESSEKEALRVKGVEARRLERERKKQLKELEQLSKKPIIGIDSTISSTLSIPIRDPQNEPTREEQEEVRLRLLPFVERVAQEQLRYDQAQAEDPSFFMDDAPEIIIDPEILQQEHVLIKKRNPLSNLTIQVDNRESDDEIEPLGGKGNREGIVICSSPPRSVASINSIAHNANFDTQESIFGKNEDFVYIEY
jgi:hypothetical protein